MTLRARNQPSPEWPFWLLLAAWFCASVPQGAMFTALAWMAEARAFTHQQRLTVDVAHLLVGEKPASPIADAVARAQERVPPKPTAPNPADIGAKKIELALEATCEVLPALLRAGHPNEVAWRCPESRRVEPPHGPPRVKVT